MHLRWRGDRGDGHLVERPHEDLRAPGEDVALPDDPVAVEAQIDAVLTDLPVAAVKTGMLATADIVRLVALQQKREQRIR